MVQSNWWSGSAYLEISLAVENLLAESPAKSILDRITPFFTLFFQHRWVYTLLLCVDLNSKGFFSGLIHPSCSGGPRTIHSFLHQVAILHNSTILFWIKTNVYTVILSEDCFCKWLLWPSSTERARYWKRALKLLSLNRGLMSPIGGPSQSLTSQGDIMTIKQNNCCS